MATHPQSTGRLAFGPFEVNTAARELRRGGLRVQLSAQPFEILLALLAHPGVVISRDTLRQGIWANGTFGDFDHGLNTAVNKLRRTLGDSAENPRYIETVSGRGYKFIGTLESQPVGPAPPLLVPVGSKEIQQKRSVGRRWWLACIPAIFGVAAVTWWLHRPTVAGPPMKFVRLTLDAGLSGSPALSRDGTLVAYSSDSGLEGEQDLYIRQVAGGQPIRLTFDGSGDSAPDFSPDGSRLLFRSSRAGAGIYEMPTFGGNARLIVRDGLNPKFSPDGTQVAFWVGAESVAESIPESGTTWIVSAAGGQPHRIEPNLTSARNPIWFPDGEHLLLTGYAASKSFDNSSIDWWMVGKNGGLAVKTGLHDALIRSGLEPPDPTGNAKDRFPTPSIPKPGCWSIADKAVIFSISIGDSQNLWEVPISARTGKVNGPLKRLTLGVGNEVDPTCESGGAVAFTNMDTTRGIWSLPFDLDRGIRNGVLERMALGPASRENPSLSANGRFLAFVSNQAGRYNVWVRELLTGKEVQVAGSSYVQRFGVINRSGSRVAFSQYEKEKRTVYVSTPGGVPEKVCPEGCLRATGWSPDEKKLLVFGGDPDQINILDLASHKQTPLLKHRSYGLLYGRFSPDNRWVSFTARIRPGRGRITIAPMDSPRPVPESSWITIAEAAADDYANWSSDGKTLYFTSDKDGHTCLWAQRIGERSHRPAGEPFVAQHLHGRISFGHGGWSGDGGRIAFALVENTGNVWTIWRSAE